MTKRARIFLLLVLTVTTVGCDRVTKRLATTFLEGMPDRSFMSDTVRLEYAENSGGFLSIGADLNPSARTAIFIIGTSLMLIVVLILGVQSHDTVWHITGISLAFAGGASNLLDRITHGTVIDFVNVGLGNLRTGIFNVADVAILVGISMLIVRCQSRLSNPTSRARPESR